MSAMPLTPSARGLVPPFIAMDVLRDATAREAAGQSVIHLEVGQPGSAAPQAVLDAARAALANDRLGYTDALGIWALRQAIARHYRDAYAVAVDRGEFAAPPAPSAPSKMAFLAALKAGAGVERGEKRQLEG